MRGPLGAQAKDKEILLKSPVLAILASLGAACGPGQAAPEASCPAPSTASTQPSPDQLARLAGRYEVTLVNENGEYGDRVARGVLVLWPNDSARRYMPRSVGRLPGERPLAGTFESHSTTVPSVPNSHQRGTEGDPAVEMVEATIYLGGLEYSDAGGNRLVVQQITTTGFRGAWDYASGFSVTVDSATGRLVQDPSGYFCARRTPEA